VYNFGYKLTSYEISFGDVPFPQEPSLINMKKDGIKDEYPNFSKDCPSKLKDLIEEH